MNIPAKNSLRLHTFGRFSIEIDGQLLKFRAKSPKKPLALLKTIITFGGINIGIDKLADTLWPDSDGDAALQALHTTLCRLRQLLGNHQFLLLQDAKLSLNTNKVWLDLWEFNYFHHSASQVNCHHDIFLTQQTRQNYARQAINYYQGLFLDNETEETWLIHYRNHLQQQFQQLLKIANITIDHPPQLQNNTTILSQAQVITT